MKPSETGHLRRVGSTTAVAVLAMVAVALGTGGTEAYLKDELLVARRKLRELQAVEAVLNAEIDKLHATPARADAPADAALAKQLKAIRAQIAALEEKHAWLVKMLTRAGEKPAPQAGNETPDGTGQISLKGPDVVMTRFGDRLSGHVIGADADGRLCLASPGCAGQVRVLISGIDRVSLARGDKQRQSDCDRVALTHGDCITGKITAITADHVEIDSRAAGFVKALRKVVGAVTFAGAGAVLIDSDFRGKDMKPWRQITGAWLVSPGVLHCQPVGLIFVELDKAGPITFEANLQASGGQGLRFEMIISDVGIETDGRDSVYAQCFDERCNVAWWQRTTGQAVATYSYGRPIRGGAFRFAYDPDAQKARMWLDSKLLGECDVPYQLKGGRYVLLKSYNACEITHLRVEGASGTSFGPGPGIGPGAADKDIIHLANGDSVSAGWVLLSGEKFEAETPYGPICCPVRNVRGVVFRTRGQEKPRMRKGDTLVQAGESRLTLQFEKLTDEYLIGNSDYLGQVKVLRSAVREIRFNPYK